MEKRRRKRINLARQSQSTSWGKSLEIHSSTRLAIKQIHVHVNIYMYMYVQCYTVT